MKVENNCSSAYYKTFTTTAIYLFVLVLFLQIYNTKEKSLKTNKGEFINLQITDAYSSRSNYKSNILNPINGTDYWSTGILKYGDYTDWIAVLKEEIIINYIQVEFDFPPARLVIYGGVNRDHWMPLAVLDYSNRIKENVSKKNNRMLIIEDSAIINTSISFKFIKFEFVNNIPGENITVLFSKVKISILADKRKFFIQKILIENDKKTHLCMKRNDFNEATGDKNEQNANSTNIINNSSLSLVNCHYCIIYHIEDCLFTYIKSDDNGHLFSLETARDHQGQFYIRKLENSKNEETNKITSNTGLNTKIEIINSFLTDQLDYKSELNHIKSNSTVEESSYSIKNVLEDDLNYWSSVLMKKPNCSTVEIELELKKEIVLKKLSILWINPPYEIYIQICQKPREDAKSKDIQASYNAAPCETLYSKDFSNLITIFEEVFLKAYTIRIQMFFDKYQIQDFSSHCISSIKKINIHKNEIELKPQNFHANEKVLYSEFFYFTYFNRTLFEAEKSPEEYDTHIEDLKTFSISEIKFHNQIKAVYSKLNEIIRKLFFYKRHQGNYRQFVKKIFPSNLTFHTGKTDDSKQIEKFLKLNKTINYILNIDHPISKMEKSFKFSQDKLRELKEDLMAFLAENSSNFLQTLSDSHIKKLTDNMNKLKDLRLKIKNFKELKILSENLVYLKSSYLDTITPSIEHFNSTLEMITANLESLKRNYLKETSEFIDMLTNSLQNEKLVNLITENVSVNLGENFERKCLPVKVIKNSYFDNFFLKMFIIIDNEDYNFLILKFYNEEYFFYLKLNSSKLEIWKRKYEKSEKLYENSNFMNVIKSKETIEDGNKNSKIILYLLIKVNEGNLSIVINSEYEKQSNLDLKYDQNFFTNSSIFLVENKNLEFSHFESIYNRNENDFKEKFEGKEIFYFYDIDLRHRGYLGYIGTQSSELLNENVYFMMVQRLNNNNNLYQQKIQKNLADNQLSSVNGDFSFNFFPSVEKMKIVDVYKILSAKLKLVDADNWKFYDSKFSVVHSFHLKFEIHFDSIFNSGNNTNSIYLVLKSERNKFFLIFEVIKMQKFFQFKIFRISEKNGKENLHRVDIDIDVDVKSSLSVFVIDKKKDYLFFKVKSLKEENYKNIFKFQNMNFLKIGFILSKINEQSVRYIYLSDLTGKEREKKNRN